MQEYEIIVEFSFNSKQDSYVVRFLSGESYVLKTTDLPKKLRTRSPEWDKAVLSTTKSALIVKAGNEIRELPAHIIHSRGKLL
jgi:hypothetical protein